MSEYQIDEKSMSRFKRLGNKQMLSFYLAADAQGTKAGLIMDKARNAKQDTTKARGKALRKELDANKFCQGLIVSDAEGTLTVVNMGGNIGDALLKKLLKKLAEEAGGDQKARLKAAAQNIADTSFLETLQQRAEDMALGDAEEGDADGTEAPLSVKDALAQLLQEVLDPKALLQEELEIMAEARSAYLIAQQTGEGLDKAAARLASALDTGSNLFDASENNADLAGVFQVLISARFVDPAESLRLDDERALTREPLQDGRIGRLVFLSHQVPIYIVTEFGAELKGVPAFRAPDGALLPEFSAVDLPAWAASVRDEAQTRLQNTLGAQESNVVAFGSQRAAAMRAKALTDHRDWLQAEIDDIMAAKLYPGAAISEEVYARTLPLAREIVRLYQQLVCEAEAAQRDETQVPPPPEELPPEPDDAWDPDDAAFLAEMRQIQADHLAVLYRRSEEKGSFKFQLAPAGFPDLLRYDGWPRPRSLLQKPFSEVLQERGYSDKIAGEYAFEGSTFLFSLKSPSGAAVSRIRGLINAHGGKAHYVGTDLSTFLDAQSPSLLSKKSTREATLQKIKDQEKALLQEEYKRIVQIASDRVTEAQQKGEVHEVPVTAIPIEVILHQTEMFSAYCAREYNDENLLFLVATHPRLAGVRGAFPEVAPMLATQGIERVLWIYDYFVQSGAQREINVSWGVRSQVAEKVRLHRAFVKAQGQDPSLAATKDVPQVSPLQPSVTREFSTCIKEVLSVMGDILKRYRP